MKKCTTCGLEKDYNEFYKCTNRKDGFQSACKSCNDIRNRSSLNKKKEHYRAIRTQSRNKTSVLFNKWKRNIGCCFCGENEPVCLELHHKDPSTKEYTIGSVRNYNWNVIMDEAQKCIMVCSNCHKKIHAGLLDDSDKPLICLDSSIGRAADL